MKEKREHPRYLCDEQFSDCELIGGGQSVLVHSINFNHQGMALFTSHLLPEADVWVVSFQHDAEEGCVVVDQLPCCLVYANETEVGNHYGISFEWEALSEDQREQLLVIEQRLAQLSKTQGRYGLGEF